MVWESAGSCEWDAGCWILRIERGGPQQQEATRGGVALLPPVGRREDQLSKSCLPLPLPLASSFRDRAPGRYFS